MSQSDKARNPMTTPKRGKKLKAPRPYKATDTKPKDAEYIRVPRIFGPINNKWLARILNGAFVCGWRCREKMIGRRGK
jgi:hypothetical protein